MVEFGVFDNVSPAYFLGDGCDFADFRGVEFEPVRDGCFAVIVGAFFDVNGVEVGPMTAQLMVPCVGGASMAICSRCPSAMGIRSHCVVPEWSVVS